MICETMFHTTVAQFKHNLVPCPLKNENSIPYLMFDPMSDKQKTTTSTLAESVMRKTLITHCTILSN
jgi:hypothetical protein